MREVALEQDVPLIDTARLLPPEPRLFGDASHFSVAGEEAFAAVLAPNWSATACWPGQAMNLAGLQFLAFTFVVYVVWRYVLSTSSRGAISCCSPATTSTARSTCALRRCWRW